MENLTFITGAARSGKSMLAEQLATKSGRTVSYIATMQVYSGDPEQVRRLQLHKDRRPSHWTTIEAPFQAEKNIAALPDENLFVVFDCLSLYITNILIGTADGGIENTTPYESEVEVLSAVKNLLAVMESKKNAHFAIVSNEVGWGVVPETPLGRAFRDFLGLANQMTAAAAHDAFLMCAGLKVQLK